MNMEPSNFNKVYEEVANLIGVEETIKIHRYFLGQQIQFPKHLYNPSFVEEYVKTHYNGTNARDLAREFGYTERTIRKFLKK